jgi:DNA-binding SARP family transcriptional activator/tetratricopeptide (TPR) repeat protein
MGPTCRLSLLGGFRAEVDGRAVPSDAWRHRRGADLLKLLALAPGHRMHREQVIDALWPDLDPEAGGRNLRKAVHFARRALGSEEAIRAEGPMVVLWPEGPLEVDAEAFESAAAEALRATDPEAARQASDLYAGELLPEDPYQPWAAGPRDRIRRMLVEVLELAGRWDRVVEEDPLDERARRELMRAALDAGDRQGAMRHFEALRSVLAEEVGVGPDPQTVALYERVLAMEGPQPSTPQERARTHLAGGLMALNRMDLQGAEREATAARTLAVEAGLGQELGEASGLLGMVAHSRGAWRDLFRQEFLQTLEEAPALASHVFDAHLCLAEFSLCGPEGPDDMAKFATELLDVAERRASPHGTAVASLLLGECELLSGRLDLAEPRLSRAADLHAEAEAPAGQALALERLAEAALGRGERSRASRLLREARPLAMRSELKTHLLVRVSGAEVQLALSGGGGIDAVKQAESELAAEEPCEPCSMPFLLASTIACAREGEAGEAERFLDHADRVASMWQGGPWLAGVWEARAELRLAGSEPVQAAALFREAAELFGRSGHSLSEERCHAAAARAGRHGRKNVRGTLSS